MEEDNWHLLPGAPEEVIKEFNEYMKDMIETMEDEMNSNFKKEV